MAFCGENRTFLKQFFSPVIQDKKKRMIACVDFFQFTFFDLSITISQQHEFLLLLFAENLEIQSHAIVALIIFIQVGIHVYIQYIYLQIWYLQEVVPYCLCILQSYRYANQLHGFSKTLLFMQQTALRVNRANEGTII